ncbi:TonB-dependent receptor [Exilibacterium tricleocarpae]|uniref:TonB-dependent receptor n=2 Tax=Exilibacterium tricleocarpae TaxID=2591008 RepID=A0A545SQV7_9GAMM|nr:TonB-dependent receptor [Exilibacterium tricleocarpae]
MSADLIEEVTVYGLRSSILDSVQAKRRADTIADLVDAGALASLPDQSIADALGRIPGVTTVRDSGQSSQLNIRGMNGDFIQTTLNGREQASTSGYTESTRWMAFDQYPAELITQAAVYKSPKASHLEGGVAATVELKTANPLEAEKDHNFAANARYSYNDAADDVGADDTGERLSFSYQGKFLDGMLGVGVGYSRLVQPNNFEGARAGADSKNGYTNADINGDGVAEDRAQSFQFQAGTGNDTRDGYLATVVFQPNDTIKAQFDYFKSEFESEDFRHGITVSGMQDAVDPAFYEILNPTISGGAVTGATIAINDPKSRNDSFPWFETRSEDQSTQADSDSYGLNVQWQLSDRASLTFDIARSEGTKTRKDRLASMHAYEFGGTATALDEDGNPDEREIYQELSGQTFTYRMNGDEIPTATFNTDFTDLNRMRLSRYEEYPHTYTDEIDSYQVDFALDVEWNFVSSIEMGVRYSERTFDSRRGTFLYGARDGQFNVVGADGRWDQYCADNLSQIDCVPQALNGFVSVGSVQGAPDHLVADLDALANAVFGPGNFEGQQVFSRDWTFVESGALDEDVFAYYLMANIDTEIAGIPVTGNFGVRVVETDVKASGVQNVGFDEDGNGLGVPITDDAGVTRTNYDYVSYGPEYTDTLPSINLNFELSEQDQIRFAAAKVLGRPPVGQLKGGAGSWVSGNDGDIYNVWSKGSPFLDPFRATQAEVSYEHYFDDGGAATVAVFWKDIETLVEDANFGPDDEWPGINVPDGFSQGEYQTKVNSEDGGYIRGIELATTKTFSNLPGIFAGLGLTASYSYTESETEVSGGGLFSGETLPLPGLSENVWSTTLFWDIGNFSTHFNVRYRDEYVLNMAVPGSSTPIFAKEYTTMDAQASYSFDNGFDMVFQVNNLTDEPNISSFGNGSVLGEYREFGRQFYVGLNYKY